MLKQIFFPFMHDIKQYVYIKDIKKVYSLLLPFMLKERKSYLIMLVLLGLDIALTIAFAWFFGSMTDAAVQSDFEKLKQLVPIGIILVVLSISSNFLDILMETKTRTGLKRDLKNHLFHHILRLPTSKYSTSRSGDLLSHFSNDIHSVDGLIGRSLINLIRLPIIYIAVFIYLVNINWELSLFSIAVAPIALVAGALFGWLLRNNSRLIHHLIGSISNLLTETLQGLPVIRSFTLEKQVYMDYKKKNQKLYELEMQNAKLQGWFSSGGQLVSSITYLVSLCLGAYYVSHNIISVGALLTFVNLVHHLVNPLTGLAGQWAGFQWSVSALERVINVLDAPTDSTALPTHFPIKERSAGIEFKGVSFCYEKDKLVLENIDLQIPPGKMVAIVGPSGAGKSTLLNLLQGFYLAQKGTILLNGKAKDDYTLSELRSMIAHVPQETFLFAGTVKDNLSLARPGVTEKEMIKAAKSADIYNFIMTLPEGFDTEIGERGIKLSGGQKQRIAIARAILKDAPILLLDEATSALDSKTESNIKNALDLLKEGRTTIIIAHRLSTIKKADLIVVMDEGRIIQMGRHAELLLQGGLYKQLNDMQFFEEKKAEVLNA
ncbi:ABC transporter ATP-binding protein [Pseudalkalibacillus caeni]|uniref:ABC transporter ATP-binding protein n=1 Tax=Exobacillus caeni TaxID=2574798 RepID=A0A5R9F3X7_9BACL|nr:ABC transporter ATP-binding protein [Pseudalkalibacillus caeni]TLS35563.1 ABC transporter ATP-binding protein [Pseudalkalibacillus caeni]